MLQPCANFGVDFQTYFQKNLLQIYFVDVLLEYTGRLQRTTLKYKLQHYHAST